MILRISFIAVLFFYCVGYASTSTSESTGTKTVSETKFEQVDFEDLKAYLTKQKFKKAAKRQAKFKRLSKKGQDRSWFISVLLAVPILLPFSGFGLHRFYLGYYWQGAIQLLLSVSFMILFLVGSLGTVLVSSLIFIPVIFIWVSIDFIRILLKNLKPKNGDYK